jgi:undecaprenyl-diphosphatase
MDDFNFCNCTFFADRSRFDKKISTNLNLKIILIIGLFQILSLIPGVSRAGITIAAARILKFNRVDSSKISFLLSIPALAGASFSKSKKSYFEKQLNTIHWYWLLFSYRLFFLILQLNIFLIYINKFSMNAFVIYRILISFLLFYLIY